MGECSQETGHQRMYTSVHNNETSATANPYRWIFRLDRINAMRSFNTSYFKIHVKINKADGSALGVEAVSCVNQLGASLIKNVDLFCNDARLYSHNEHPMTAYLENMLTLSCEAKETWPHLLGYYPDKAGNFESMADGDNPGFAARRTMFKNGQEMEFWVRPNCFPFIVPKMWPGQMPVRFEIDRTSSKFVLLAAAATTAKIEVTKIAIELSTA